MGPDGQRATFRYEDALTVLEDRGFGLKAELGRMAELTELLDSPQLTYPTLHIAGTNGKTTTARIIAMTLAAHGLTAGAYTSPHLETIRERFALCGSGAQGLLSEWVSEAEFAGVVDYLRPFVEQVESARGEHVTYFEYTTGIAFEWFAQRTVEAGVFECGLGGAWDATNVIVPEVGVLTRIAVDHERFLGTTPLSNAKEKAGIIKQGGRVVTAQQDPDVASLIRTTAAGMGADVFELGSDFQLVGDTPAVGGRRVGVSGLYGAYEDLLLPLFGAHQSQNFAVAVAACEAFLARRLDMDSLRAAAAAVTSPGRLEVVGREPLVVLDGAHNPDGARALGPAVEESFGPLRRTFVVSIFEDKDAAGIIEALRPYADKLVFTAHTSVGERAPADPRALAAMAPGSEVITPLVEALDAATGSALDDEIVVVCGSLWAVGEARSYLVGEQLRG